MEYESDSPHPGIMMNDKDAHEMTAIQYRAHRGKDPDRREAQLQALRRVCASEDECNDTLMAIRHHERQTNSVVSASDIPAIVDKPGQNLMALRQFW